MNDFLKKRQNIRQMDQQDLQNYRAAIRRMQTLPASDERSFAHIAGIHGYPPPSYCHQDAAIFLPWHRAYVLYLEGALNEMLELLFKDGSSEITPDINGNGLEVAPKIGVPWWDWSSDISHQQGIPRAFSDKNARNGQVNPLWETEMLLQSHKPDIRETLYRESGNKMFNTRGMDDDLLPTPPLWRLPSQNQIEVLLGLDDFMDFQSRLDGGIHGLVHVWVGGTMSSITTAGWDPIFYSHHCMVDRIWYLWQLRHNALDKIPGIPEEYYKIALPPFKMTVEETMNTRNLKYEYTSSTTVIELV